MDGLIVKQPFAKKLVRGIKEYEYRSKPLPKMKTNVKILILNSGNVLGYVVFDGDDFEDGLYKWHVLESKEFSPYMKYRHKNGCVIWINNVDVFE